MAFPELLAESSRRTATCACMGLDPVLLALPSGEKSLRPRLVDFFGELFDRMLREGAVPAAFKPNVGFFHVLNRPLEDDYAGSQALADVIRMVRDSFPGIPLILDAKRGDIAGSSANYAAEAFDVWQADAVTVHPFMGDDSLEPFCEKACEAGGGVYVLNRTSNPGAVRFQNLEVRCGSVSTTPSSLPKGCPLYEEVSRAVAGWAETYPGTGAVVGATSIDELERIVAIYSANPVPLLVPGVGSQGGSAMEVIEVLARHGYPLGLVRINSSSGITHPWKKRGKKAPGRWIDECMEALGALVDACRV